MNMLKLAGEALLQVWCDHINRKIELPPETLKMVTDAMAALGVRV